MVSVLKNPFEFLDFIEERKFFSYHGYVRKRCWAQFKAFAAKVLFFPLLIFIDIAAPTAIGSEPGTIPDEKILYLGNLDESLYLPRKKNPRTHIPKGSIGIAGNQTGIYPLSSPGGWNLIGKTTIPIFNINEPEMSYVQMGDKIRFIPINENSTEFIS